VVSWYNGLFGILTFAIQMVLILVTGHALANTPIVTGGLTRLVALCRTPNQSMVMTFLVTCLGSWINWGFGLVIGAILAREVARHIRIDFGWLVAAAYAGWMPWCIGPSSSIPLAQASHGNPLNVVEKVTGHGLPFSDTIFTASSMVPTLIIVALIPIAFILAAPRRDDMVVAQFLEEPAVRTHPAPVQRGWVRRFERSRICNMILVVAGVAYFGVSWRAGSFVYALAYWQPQIVKSFGLTNLQTGFVNAIPFGIAAVTMVLWARRSDVTGERVWHTAAPLLLAAVGLFVCMMLSTLTPTMVALTVALIGVYAVKAPMFALTAESLSSSASPVGIAQVCALGNIAGLVCPLLVGAIKDWTGNFNMGLLPMVVLALLAAWITLALGRARPVLSAAASL
jgi:hypothetical protein